MRLVDGAPDTNRTCDPLLRRKMLYPLSYGGQHATIAAREDLRQEQVKRRLINDLLVIYDHRLKSLMTFIGGTTRITGPDV